MVEAAEGDMADFARIHLDGHEVPGEDRGPAEAAVRAWFGRPGWRLYLALVDGTPAGSAALTVDAGLGYLANAATLPAMRGRGCQTGLLARRIADAAAAGCDTVASLAEFGTGSQRNLERAQAQRAQMDDYVRSTAGSGGAAAEIEKAKQLLDSGAITKPEFDALKQKALA